MTENKNNLRGCGEFRAGGGARRAAVQSLVAVAALILVASRVPALPQTSAPPAARTSEFDRIAQEAKQARAANQTKRATAFYQQALKLNPRWEEGWWDLGTLYYDDNQYARGVDAFKNLVELDPEIGTAWAMLGLCEFETRDYGNSFIHINMAFQKGLANNKDLDEVVRYHLGLLDIIHGDFEEAFTELRGVAFEGGASNQIRFALGLALLRVPLLPSQVDPTKDAVIEKAGEAGELMAQQDYSDAQKVLEQLTRDYPTTPFVHYAYGSMLAGFGHPEEALTQFDQEIKVNPESPWPYIQVAGVDLGLSKYQGAMTNARKAVAMLPKSFIAHYFLGRALLGLNQVPAAVEELRTAKRFAPSVAEIRFNLAMALARDNQPKAAAQERAAFERLEAAIQQKRRLVQRPDNSAGESASPGTPSADQAKDPSGITPQ